MVFLVFFRCKCGAEFCFLDSELTQDFNPTCDCGSSALVEYDQKEYKSKDEANKAKISFERQAQAKIQVFIKESEELKRQNEQSNQPILSYYEVRFCSQCKRNYVIPNTENECKAPARHHIGESGGGKKYYATEFRAFENAQIDCDIKNRELPTQSVSPARILNLYFESRQFGLSEISELHNVIYKNWAISRIFNENEDAWEYNSEYASFLDEYYCKIEIERTRREQPYSESELESREEELFKQSKSKRMGLLNRINTATNDANERFYLYIRECGLVQNMDLYWRTSKGVVKFDSIEKFAKEYVGITNNYSLPLDEKRRIINKHTLKYFFFKEDSDTFDRDYYDENLRLLYLTIKYSNHIAKFGSIDDFRNGLCLCDEKTEEREEFLRQLKNPINDYDIATEILNLIRGSDYIDSNSLQSIPEDFLSEDNAYLAEIKHDYFTNYLELCREWANIHSHKKIRVLGLELPLDMGGAEKAIKGIITQAYLSQCDATYAIKQEHLRRLAIIRLLFKVDILRISTSLDHAIDDSASFFGRIKKAICSDEGYSKILRKTYLNCCDSPKKNIKIVEVDRKPQTLLEILKTVKGSQDDALIAAYDNPAIKDLMEYILEDGNTYNSLLKNAERITSNLRQASDKLDAVINEKRKLFVLEKTDIPTSISDTATVAVQAKSNEGVTKEDRTKNKNSDGKRFTNPLS